MERGWSSPFTRRHARSLPLSVGQQQRSSSQLLGSMRSSLSLALLLAALGHTSSAMAAPVATNRVPARYQEPCKPSDVSQKSATMWEVSGGKCLEVFLALTGPREMIGCNLTSPKAFGITSSAKALVSMQPHSTARLSSATVYTKHALSDSFTLTTAGKERLDQINRRNLSDPVVVRGTLYCSGKPSAASKHSLAVAGHAGQNCQRACGGSGKCAAGCQKDGALGHYCQYHLLLTMTLSQVKQNKVTVSAVASHTMGSVLWNPCHHQALNTSALVLDDLVHNGTIFNKTATAVVNTHAGEFYLCVPGLGGPS